MVPFNYHFGGFCDGVWLCFVGNGLFSNATASVTAPGPCSSWTAWWRRCGRRGNLWLKPICHVWWPGKPCFNCKPLGLGPLDFGDFGDSVQIEFYCEIVSRATRNQQKFIWMVFLATRNSIFQTNPFSFQMWCTGAGLSILQPIRLYHHLMSLGFAPPVVVRVGSHSPKEHQFWIVLSLYIFSIQNGYRFKSHMNPTISWRPWHFHVFDPSPWLRGSALNSYSYCGALMPWRPRSGGPARGTVKNCWKSRRNVSLRHGLGLFPKRVLLDCIGLRIFLDCIGLPKLKNDEKRADIYIYIYIYICICICIYSLLVYWRFMQSALTSDGSGHPIGIIT